ncbi:hypothetical protein F5B21DRAFT_518463 [Xylaria acuta]|nr:hypothetical protein F5B21DRAFT_518463 [Xylaria acuta]
MLKEMTRDSLSSDVVLSARENLRENLLSEHTEDAHYSFPKERTRQLRLYASVAAALVTSNIGPVFDQLNIPTKLRDLHIPLMPNVTDPRNIYRLPPSPANEIHKLRKDPSLTIRSPESWGDGYMSQIDGKKYDLTPPVQFEMHLNYCLGTMLENLMCRADVDIVTFNWRAREKLNGTIERWKALAKSANAKQRQMPLGLSEFGSLGTGEIDGVRVLRLGDVPEECLPKE